MSHVMIKWGYCLCRNKGTDQLLSNCEADQRLCVTQIVQFLYFINPKFPPSSHVLYMYDWVCVGSGRKPGRPVLWRRSSFTMYHYDCYYIFQIDLMGQSIYEFAHPCDHDEIEDALSPHPREMEESSHRAMFIRLKCTLTSKGRNVNLKSATYKVGICFDLFNQPQ